MIIEKKRQKSIKQIDVSTNNVIKIWISIKEAAANLNIDNGNLTRACKKNRICKNFRWEYA